MKVHCLKPLHIELNKYTGQFLVSAIKSSLRQSSYADQISSTLLPSLNIKLPAINNKTPNWAYMEQYMQNIEGKVNSDILSITSALDGPKSQIKVDTTTWRRFHLYDDELFTIDNGTKLDRVKMSENNPSINFVGRANANNGVTACVDKIERIKPYDAGCLTISLGGRISWLLFRTGETVLYKSKCKCINTETSYVRLL